MNGGKITPTHTLYMVSFKKGEIMKSFNEWVKSRLNEERKDYTGWFLGRELLCMKCGHTWENKDPTLNVGMSSYYPDISRGAPPPLQFSDGNEYQPEEKVRCPKCNAQSDGEGNVIRWDAKGSWTEPDSWGPQGAGLDHDYGPGGDPSDSQDMTYHDRDEFRRPEY
jgi:hypothetical protein